jgi:hypothetical protein
VAFSGGRIVKTFARFGEQRRSIEGSRRVYKKALKNKINATKDAEQAAKLDVEAASARASAKRLVNGLYYYLQPANGVPTYAGASEAFAELYGIGICGDGCAKWKESDILKTFPKTLALLKEMVKP